MQQHHQHNYDLITQLNIKSHKFDFDFEQEVPIQKSTSHSNHYKFIPASQAPDFYKEKMAVETKPYIVFNIKQSPQKDQETLIDQ